MYYLPNHIATFVQLYNKLFYQQTVCFGLKTGQAGSILNKILNTKSKYGATVTFRNE